MSERGEWQPGFVQYHPGDTVEYQGDTLYRVYSIVADRLALFKGQKYKNIQGHASQPDWPPSGTPALWEHIGDARESYQQPPQQHPPSQQHFNQPQEQRPPPPQKWDSQPQGLSTVSSLKTLTAPLTFCAPLSIVSIISSAEHWIHRRQWRER